MLKQTLNKAMFVILRREKMINEPKIIEGMGNHKLKTHHSMYP